MPLWNFIEVSDQPWYGRNLRRPHQIRNCIQVLASITCQYPKLYCIFWPNMKIFTFPWTKNSFLRSCCPQCYCTNYHWTASLEEFTRSPTSHESMRGLYLRNVLHSSSLLNNWLGWAYSTFSLEKTNFWNGSQTNLYVICQQKNRSGQFRKQRNIGTNFPFTYLLTSFIFVSKLVESLLALQKPAFVSRVQHGSICIMAANPPIM